MRNVQNLVNFQFSQKIKAKNY